MTTRRDRRIREPLTAAEWRRVFDLRCRSKRGERISAADQALVEAAFQEDPDRYGRMEDDVFDATVPFGSAARARRKR